MRDVAASTSPAVDPSTPIATTISARRMRRSMAASSIAAVLPEAPASMGW